MSMLTEKELDQVTGGTANDNIIKTINTVYTRLPEEIRKEIIEALNKYGKKAAYSLAKKLIEKKFVWATPLLELLK